MPQIVSAHYGKSGIPVMKIERSGERHQLFQAVVSIDIEGPDIVDAYRRGHNTAILATDTMKNLVYALIFSYQITSIEDLARYLGREFLRRYATISRATVTVEDVAWQRIIQRDGEDEVVNPIAFQRRGGEQDYTRVLARRNSLDIESGTHNLTLLKTTDSAFSGYILDDFTTLPETEDRVLATSVSASWKLRDDDLDYREMGCQIKVLLVDVFARFKSRSVQHLAHEMATSVLAACEAVLEISLTLPNLHCNLLDLSRFGLANEDTLFVPTDAPHGDLHLTMAR